MSQYLLDDQTIQDFIINGYLILKPQLPMAYHQATYAQLSAMIEADDNPGNELLTVAPYLHEVLEDPVITGALESLVGPNNVRNRHCHCHAWGPGNETQGWHKDYPLGSNMRYHRGRTLLLFYYPQDVTPNMGPTAIQPGSQYYKHSTPNLPGLNLCAQAGSVVITHYELWHQATANTSKHMRFMLKFLYHRTEEPNAPSWNCANTEWQPDSHPLFPHRNLWQHMWHWHTGAAKPISYLNGVPSDVEITALKSADTSQRCRAADHLGRYGPTNQNALNALADALNDNAEAVRLNAAYALGSSGSQAIPTLLQALEQEAATNWEINLEDNNFTNPSQLDIPYGLAAIGHDAVAPLNVLVKDHPDWFMRAACIATLGCIGSQAHTALPALTTALADPNEWVARNAADALGNIACPHYDISPALLKTLGDTRPVTAWSLGKDPLRENAAAALAKMDKLPKHIIKPLQTVQKDAGEYLQFWTQIALNRQRYHS